MILIKNGTVKTMAGPDIENGQVLLDGGKIVAVGKEVEAPADAQVIDAAGCLWTAIATSAWRKPPSALKAQTAMNAPTP